MVLGLRACVLGHCLLLARLGGVVQWIAGGGASERKYCLLCDDYLRAVLWSLSVRVACSRAFIWFPDLA